MNLDILNQIAGKWLLANGIKIIFILFAVLLANRVINSAFKKFLKSKNELNAEHNKNLHTICSILKSIINFSILIVAGMLILELLGVNIGPILAAAGVLGVAVGFGSQRLVEDIISGFIILLNNQIRVNDVVNLDGKIGTVEKITLNMVVLRDETGSVHFIRNGKIGVITNMTKDFSYYVSEVKVEQSENFERIYEILKQVEAELKSDSNFEKYILGELEIFGLEKFENSTQHIKIKIKTKPARQWSIGQEFNLRLKKKFDESSIEVK